jgi:hypothetical protein
MAGVTDRDVPGSAIDASSEWPWSPRMRTQDLPRSPTRGLRPQH